MQAKSTASRSVGLSVSYPVARVQADVAVRPARVVAHCMPHHCHAMRRRCLRAHLHAPRCVLCDKGNPETLKPEHRTMNPWERAPRRLAELDERAARGGKPRWVEVRGPCTAAAGTAPPRRVPAALEPGCGHSHGKHTCSRMRVRVGAGAQRRRMGQLLCSRTDCTAVRWPANVSALAASQGLAHARAATCPPCRKRRSTCGTSSGSSCCGGTRESS